jgi:hypothetical protein
MEKAEETLEKKWQEALLAIMGEKGIRFIKLIFPQRLIQLLVLVKREQGTSSRT